MLEAGLLSLESSEGRSAAISGEIVDEERRDVRFSAFEIESSDLACKADPQREDR